RIRLIYRCIRFFLHYNLETQKKQAFMIDDSLTIEKLLSTQNSQLLDAVRYTVGEGIEKVVTDFAAEVAQQMNNNYF
ncbi:hypothetical protein ABC507_02850, partial [Mycoplasmopsis synoviae]